MDFIVHWVTQYEYVGIFILLMLGIVGVPVPDEILLLFSGYMVYKGKLALLTTLIVAFLGTVCGISLSYILGRTLGVALVHRYGHYFHITEERLQTAHNWFHRAGRWALFLGYFVPGFRHVMAYLAGTTKLSLPEFAFFAYGGGLFWSMTFILTGRFLGEKWMGMSGRIHRILLIISAAVVAILIFYFLVKKFFKGNNKGINFK